MKFSINEETLNPESLLASFSVVRNSLCSVSPSGDMHSQYMLVALDKGKFTTINRSSFIKSDANGNKNKLNISKICNGDVPFTILRMYANPLCESFVAFCGIRECYVVVLQSNGQVTEKSLPVQVGKEYFYDTVDCFIHDGLLIYLVFVLHVLENTITEYSGLIVIRAIST